MEYGIVFIYHERKTMPFNICFFFVVQFAIDSSSTFFNLIYCIVLKIPFTMCNPTCE